MKNFLQNLLIFFSLCLCGLIAFQWVRETGLRKDLQTRTDELHNKMEAIQGLESNLRQDEAEIKRLDGLRSQLVDTVKTNQIEIASLKKDLDKTTRELDTNIKQVEVYKDAIERAN